MANCAQCGHRLTGGPYCTRCGLEVDQSSPADDPQAASPAPETPDSPEAEDAVATDPAEAVDAPEPDETPAETTSLSLPRITAYGEDAPASGTGAPADSDGEPSSSVGESAAERDSDAGSGSGSDAESGSEPDIEPDVETTAIRPAPPVGPPPAAPPAGAPTAPPPAAPPSAPPPTAPPAAAPPRTAPPSVMPRTLVPPTAVPPSAPPPPVAPPSTPPPTTPPVTSQPDPAADPADPVDAGSTDEADGPAHSPEHGPEHAAETTGRADAVEPDHSADTSDTTAPEQPADETGKTDEPEQAGHAGAVVAAAGLAAGAGVAGIAAHGGDDPGDPDGPSEPSEPGDTQIRPGSPLTRPAEPAATDRAEDPEATQTFTPLDAADLADPDQTAERPRHVSQPGPASRWEPPTHTQPDQQPEPTTPTGYARFVEPSGTLVDHGHGVGHHDEDEAQRPGERGEPYTQYVGSYAASPAYVGSADTAQAPAAHEPATHEPSAHHDEGRYALPGEQQAPQEYVDALMAARSGDHPSTWVVSLWVGLIFMIVLLLAGFWLMGH